VKLRFQLETAVFRLTIGLARVLPRRLLLALGGFAGELGWLFDGRHRRIALDNVRMAYGDTISPAEAHRLVRRCWRHFGRISVDLLRFERYGPETLEKIRFEGLDHIRAAYARGRGVLVFSGHFGHWELNALMQGYLGLPLALVTRPLDNPRLEELLAKIRSSSGNQVLHKRNAVRAMRKALSQGVGVAIVIDQDAHADGVFVPFFGRPASTTPTLAVLALRTGAAVVPTFSVAGPDGTYVVHYGPEVRVESTGDRNEDIRRVTAECTAIIEQWVRRHPEMWLWMHRRWKTPPPEGLGYHAAAPEAK